MHFTKTHKKIDYASLYRVTKIQIFCSLRNLVRRFSRAVLIFSIDLFCFCFFLRMRVSFFFLHTKMAVYDVIVCIESNLHANVRGDRINFRIRRRSEIDEYIKKSYCNNNAYTLTLYVLLLTV